MTTLEILEKARATIENPENWTQGASARNAAGGPVSVPCGVRPSEATRWCADGALCLVSPDIASYLEASETVNDTAIQLFGDDYIAVNDNEGHAATLKMFDHAIATLKGNP